MTGYLLDTNTISDFVRHHQGQVARRLATLGTDVEIVTSIIVAAELRFGAVKRGARRLTQRIENVLAAIPALPFEAPADAIYGRVRADLERRGQPIGGNDLLIAAHAIASGHTLVTANAREFSRIPELACENWLTA